MHACFPILLLAMNCGADEDRPFFGGASFFANAGAGCFSSSKCAGEISEWATFFGLWPANSGTPSQPWLGFDQGVFFDQRKAVAYFDVKIAMQWPFPQSATGISAGAQINKSGYPSVQNSIWISVPSIVSPSLSIKFIYDAWIPRPEIGAFVKIPIVFSGLNR
jgi:hypothetical protein